MAASKGNAGSAPGDAAPKKSTTKTTKASAAAQGSAQPSAVAGTPAAALPMREASRLIGLSLGADICWPGAYEQILRNMDLQIAWQGADGQPEKVRVACERVSIEPFDLRQPVRHHVVVDRLTHWFHTSREWIKKGILMDGLYVLNNPWSVQSMEKHTSYAALMALGFPVPDTWMLPPRDHTGANPDVTPTLQKYARLFDLEKVAAEIGYPFFMKPFDGGAWVGVTHIKDAEDLKKAYAESGTRIMHLQKAVSDYDLFVRTVGVGPQVRMMRYDPTAPLHARYVVDFMFVDSDEYRYLVDQMLTINAFFGWEHNSCESLRKDGVFYPIDYANPCPDFQVTSLHFYWPDLVKDMLRWSIFNAVARRPFRKCMDWEPFYAVARKDLPFRERLTGYADIARDRMDAARFADFCQTHLSHLDEVAWEFFGTPACKELVREKVTALFPAHEIEKFTEHFYGLVQFWRKCERDRLDRKAGKPPQAALAAAGGAA